MQNKYVMRSLYLSPQEDGHLRDLAFRLNVAKSDLIRAAIRSKIEVWGAMNDPDAILKDIKWGDKSDALADTKAVKVRVRKQSATAQGNAKPAAPERKAASESTSQFDQAGAG